LKRPATIIAAVLLVFALSGCGGSGAPTLVGNWRADDGTGTKVITSDGRCSGMYYSRGEPLDIGGGMGCSLSSKKGSDGRYSLVVTQPLIGDPLNQETLKVSFDGDDEVTIYDSSGVRLFSMTRQ